MFGFAYSGGWLLKKYLFFSRREAGGLKQEANKMPQASRFLPRA